jgi:hypothetical protein
MVGDQPSQHAAGGSSQARGLSPTPRSVHRSVGHAAPAVRRLGLRTADVWMSSVTWSTARLRRGRLAPRARRCGACPSRPRSADPARRALLRSSARPGAGSSVRPRAPRVRARARRARGHDPCGSPASPAAEAWYARSDPRHPQTDSPRETAGRSGGKDLWWGCADGLVEDVEGDIRLGGAGDHTRRNSGDRSEQEHRDHNHEDLLVGAVGPSGHPAKPRGPAPITRVSAFQASRTDYLSGNRWHRFRRESVA